MRQTDILPAALNTTTPLYGTHISAKYFYYASTVAIYVYTLENFTLVNVVTVGDSSITSFSVGGPLESRLIIAFLSGLIVCYDMNLHKVVSSTTGPQARGTIVLSTPHDPDICVIIDNRDNVLNRAVSWIHHNESTNSNTISKHKILEFKVDVRINVARWHPHIHSYLALGSKNGDVYLFNYGASTKRVFKKNDANSYNVVDVQWDRLSSVYLLVAYSNFVSLWDTETQTEINVFDKQPVGITSVAWMDWTAGSFLTANAKNGTLRVWNVSQKAPMDTIRVGDVGIAYFHLGPGTKQAICAHVDGSVSVFHLEKQHLDFSTGFGHRETIFDCKFNPIDPDTFATVSFDQTLRLWNTSDLSPKKTMFSDCCMYCVAWSPSGRLVAGSTASGLVIVWSSATGKELARYGHHNKAVFTVTWNQLQPNTLASSGVDQSVVIFEINEDELLQDSTDIPRGSVKGQVKKISPSVVKLKINLPTQVFGVQFCPTNANYLICGGHDGSIRLIDYLAQDPLVCVMKGHTGRVFHLGFSPFIPGLIASGSDDKAINLYQLDLEKLGSRPRNDDSSKVLTIEQPNKGRMTGHTSYVRAIQFNTEFANILLSGSWDATIRVWNLDTQECLQVVEGHAADVYALCSHPVRPLSYISGSRDGTLRKWEFEGAARLSLAQSVWDCSLDGSRAKDGPGGDGPGSDQRKGLYKLSGKNSLILNHKLGSPEPALAVKEGRGIDERIELAKKYYEIFNFYCGNSGAMDVWECALSLLIGEKTSSQPLPLPRAMLLRPGECCTVLSRSEIVMNTDSDARKVDSVKASARGEHMSEKTRTTLRNAAKMFARVGNYQKYCSIMVELGQYQEALALAPCVSFGYWKELSMEYADEMAAKSSEECIPFFMGTGQGEKAVSFYVGRKDMKSALITASKAEATAGINPVRSKTPPRSNVVQVGSSIRRSAFSAEINAAASDAMGLTDPKALVNSVCFAAADEFVRKGQPILAAAQHVSIGNVSNAIDLLVSCGEYELALALSTCFNLATPEARRLLAHRTAHQGGISLAIRLIDTLPREEAEIEKALAIHQVVRDEDLRKDLLASNSLRSRSSWSNLASEKEVMGSDSEAVLPLIMSGQYNKAVTLSLGILRGFVRDPLELTAEARSVLHCLKFVKAEEVEEQLRVSFLMHMLWFTAHEAAELGIWKTGASMLLKLQEMCGRNSFAIPADEVHFQEIFFLVLAGEESVKSKLEKIIHQNGQDPKLGARFDALLKAVRGAKDRYSMTTNERRRRIGEASSMSGNVYGSATDDIRDMTTKLGDSMSLPSLSRLALKRPGCGSEPVVLGSLLPSAHHYSDVRSAMSGDLITGPAVRVQSGSARSSTEAYASVNEALGWIRVNPFEPGSSGRWLVHTISAPPM